MDEKLFTKGFNDGYTLEENKPGFMGSILKGIINAPADNSYIEGLKEGQKQRQNELEREHIKQSIERGNGLDKGKDRDLSR